eukprot:CAMPEP_0178395446 /NCGR_PEP_ID=MMETSP0689_2-20121128/13223_1 /TAXON_ID=160604 /ORGANISM="Amphidinium massartii, Strain CS-259" /LENGTH=148 /DNA_ID=CAMNT_0020016101 /DNA_START=184 /DNA_END=631 /DNA_ORIENTATION=+
MFGTAPSAADIAATHELPQSLPASRLRSGAESSDARDTLFNHGFASSGKALVPQHAHLHSLRQSTGCKGGRWGLCAQIWIDLNAKVLVSTTILPPLAGAVGACAASGSLGAGSTTAAAAVSVSPTSSAVAALAVDNPALAAEPASGNP